jgi:hypothetical protein
MLHVDVIESAASEGKNSHFFLTQRHRDREAQSGEVYKAGTLYL